MMRLAGPGVLRLSLALAVFLSHVSRFNVGRLAVMLFFILSGYWVTRLYLAKGNETTFGYMRDRILRIWPMLALVTICVATGQYIALGLYHGSILSTLALLGLANRSDDVVGVTWSLDIELQFYLLLPLALAAKNVLGAWTPVLLLLLYLSGLFFLRHDVQTVLAYTPAFAAGSFIALTKYSPSGRIAVASAATFLVAMAAASLIPALRPMVVKTGDLWWPDSGLMAFCMILLPFLAWNVNTKSNSLDRTLGNLAYPLYLIHVGVIDVFANTMPSRLLDKLVALAVAMAATGMVYAFFDRPLEVWRHRLRKRSSKSLGMIDPLATANQ